MRNDQPHMDDSILRLQRRIDDLENRIAALKSNSHQTIPIYDAQTMTELDTHDGETWITGNKMFFQSGGVVRQITSSP